MKKITVIFVLYHAERQVAQLLEAVRAQKHPIATNQADWLDVLFIDDCSPDNTVQNLTKCLAKIGNPSHYKVEVNSTNLGLSKNLNKAFGMVTTPYALTCHCDCFFGREDYVAKMAELLDKNPKAGAITGQQTIPEGEAARELPFAEKLNLITNLMDIFPPETDRDLISIGFAEGRCDAFRIEALKAVGFYDTKLRLAGEDQILAARLREKGFEVCQAPKLNYRISVSSSQDSIWKLVQHQRLFGRAHPYILLKSESTKAGIFGDQAGDNRQGRTVLRIAQLVSVLVYLEALVGIARGEFFSKLLLVIFWTLLLKTPLFWRHIRAVKPTAKELGLIYLVQPLLDISYATGFCHGLLLYARGADAESIS